jgi:hypothetical protein
MHNAGGELPRTSIRLSSHSGDSAKFAYTEFYEVGSLDVFLEALEVGCLVGPSPYKISRPE